MHKKGEVVRYGVISDIHANLEALQAVTAACGKLAVDEYLCTGDIVGYNADPAACLKIIRSLPLAGAVKGNHDHRAVTRAGIDFFQSAAATSIEWTRSQLCRSSAKWLHRLPMSCIVGNITLVHASLHSPDQWYYICNYTDAMASLRLLNTNICFFGHSHVPLAFEKGDMLSGGLYRKIHIHPQRRYLINTGSVGQPRDGNNMAAFAIYDTARAEVELHRVPYDIRATQKKILRAGLPARNAKRLEYGK